MTTASLLDHAAQRPVLSCDIFDTVVRRTLARPEDVFLAVGARLRRLITCTPEDFALHRQTAERAAREIATRQGHDEVRLAEIYEWLASCGIVTDPEQAARVEFHVECDICVPIETVRSAVMAHPCAVFASDTQLPGPWLQALLERCGYGPARRVFSSADLRLSKHTGRLFPAMLAALARPASDILHIGDNPVSDVERPRAHGIAARLLPRDRPAAGGFDDCHFVTRLAVSHASARPSRSHGPEHVGAMLARIATPLLIGFALFIIAQARARGISRLYFLARDGHLPMAVVANLLAASGETEAFALQYLDVSRASMADIDPARSYLQRLGFLRPGLRMVIDLGWRGSIQASLQEIAGDGADIFGCYVGLWADALRPAINPGNAAGYLFNFGAPQSMARQVREFYVVLELIFSAPHGTVLGYMAEAIEPARAIEEAPGGPLRRAVFAALEADCLDTVEALGRMIANDWPEGIESASALAPLAQALMRPTRAVLAAVNSVPFIHDADGAALLPAVNPLPLHEAILAPRRSLKRLQNAPWRSGAVRAALPSFMPSIDFATLTRALRRLGIEV